MSAEIESSIVSFLKQFADLGNSNAFAVRSANGGYRPVRRAITQADILAHLRGRAPVGTYLVIGDCARIGAIDLDSHDGGIDWPTMVSIAKAMATWLIEQGYVALAVRSGGGAGIHLFVLFERDQLARDIRTLLTACVESCGFKVGTRGVGKSEAEVFPKQDSVSPNALGNLIALPLARASCGLGANFQELSAEHFTIRGLSPFLNGKSTGEQASSANLNEASVSKKRILSSAPRATALQALPGDIDLAADALRAVSAESYDSWILIGFALRAAFGDAGFGVWLQWSKSVAAKFPGETECQRKWSSFPLRGEVGLGTIFHMARANGWNGGDAEDWVREMNAQYGILTHAKDTLIILKKHAAEHEVFGMLGTRQFHDRLAAETVQVPGGRGAGAVASKSKTWFEHPHASRYEEIIFNPALPPGENDKAWNTWTGFSFDPKPGKWDLLEWHIRENICRRNDDEAEWLLNWMADGVQNPGDVIGTAPVFVGQPGTGKSFLARTYGRLWGKHFVIVTSHDHVQGRFTGHLIGRRVIFVDEGTFGGNRKEAGVLKTRITEPTVMYELKGIDPVFMPNRTIWLIASNEKSVVPADKADRRWQVFEVSNERREQRDYFQAIQAQLEAGGYAAMLHDLLTRDISNGPNPRVTIKTEALFDQILRAQGPEERYLVKILDEGRLPQNYVRGANITTVRALHEDLQASEVDGRRVHLNGFGRLLREVFSEITTKRGGRFHIKEDLFATSMEYVFPPLSACRAALQAYLRCPIPWSNEGGDWQSDPTPNGRGEGVL